MLYVCTGLVEPHGRRFAILNIHTKTNIVTNPNPNTNCNSKPNTKTRDVKIEFFGQSITETKKTIFIRLSFFSLHYTAALR